jgi:sterol desaturase/sphingolipid hydroxylase (fatty acid hydroxylase superfamily)
VRVGENVLNHCGLDSPILTLLSLKFLPLRASPAFHDYHHRHSNYAGHAKNYAENFVVWDILFGTASRRKGSDPQCRPVALASSNFSKLR